MTNLYWYLIGYMVLLLGVAFWAAQKNSAEDFLIAGRNRKFLQIMTSKFATTVGVSWFITYTGYAYLYGFSILTILPGFLISYWLFAYWAVPRLYKNSQKQKFYTQGDFVLSQTGNAVDRKLIDWSGIIINLIWLLVAVIGGAKVISFLGVLSYEGALFMTSLIILIYILLSGYRAVIITDIIQTFVILGLLGGIVVLLLQTEGIENVFTQGSGTIDVGLAVGMFIYGVFSLFSMPDRYQLTFSAKNTKEAQRGMGLAIIPVTLTLFLLLFVGLYVHSLNPTLDPDLVFIKLFFQYLPEAFVSMGALLFLAGLMSSADTSIFNITSYLAFLKNKRGDKVQQIRILTLGLVFFIAVIAYFVRDIIGATILGAGITLVPSVAMVYIISGGKSSAQFLSLLAGGTLGIIVGIALCGLTPTIAIFPIIFALLGGGMQRLCRLRR